MGGNAFPDLFIPRIPSVLYYRLRDEYQLLLERIFGSVASPIPGPAKISHGDIDFLVTYPEPEKAQTEANDLKARYAADAIEREKFELSEQNPYVLEVHKAFQYERAISQGPTISFAVPHLDPSLKGGFVQLDLHLCESVAHLEWLKFYHSHGDLWNMFGTSLRPFGFTASDKGFYVRDPVIEAIDGKRSRTLLTSDPRRVLHFLGVSEEKYPGGNLCNGRDVDVRRDEDCSGERIHSDGETYIESRAVGKSDADILDRELGTQPPMVEKNLAIRQRGKRTFQEFQESQEFESEGDLFAYVITCRFFRKKWYDKDTLKANDRQRQAKRHQFRKFTEEFVPTLPDDAEDQCSKEWLREQRDSLREEALKEFGKEDEFNALRQAWKEEREILHAKKIVRSMKEAESHQNMTYSDGWMREIGGEWKDYLEKSGQPKPLAGWDQGWREGKEDVGWE